MSFFPRPPRPLALAALAAIIGAALLAGALRATAQPARAAERASMPGAAAGAPPAAPPAAPQAQAQFGAWTPMATLGHAAEATSAPTVVSWGPGRLDVFVRGRSGELYQNYRENGRWSGWSVPQAFRGVVLRSAPSCASWGPSRISCVALIEAPDAASRDGVWHFYYDGTGWARQNLGGVAASAPAVVSPARSQLAVFVVGGGQVLFGRSWVSDQWSEWTDLTGTHRSTPACAAWPGDTAIQCFVTGREGQIMRQEVLIGRGTIRGLGYVDVTMLTQTGNRLTLGAAPAAVAVGPRRISLLALNSSQALHSTIWPGQGQGLPWLMQITSDPNAPWLNSPPSCVVLGGRLECFARGPDSRMLNAFGDLVTSIANVP